MEEKVEREFANEISPVSDSQQAADTDHNPENLAPPIVNHEYSESNCEANDKEITGIIEVIAATGRFWHDWGTLKSLLSCRLKQVLAEYSESQTVAGPEPQQSSSSNEIHTELEKRLDEELLSFVEGPPFTLQRICEILLNARHIYPKLSKLALALEKNLLVTSTLSISTDPYPGAVTSISTDPYPGAVTSISTDPYPGAVTSISTDPYPGAVTSISTDPYPGAVTGISTDPYPGAVTSISTDSYPGAVASISTDPYPGAVTGRPPEDNQQSGHGVGDKCTGNEHIQEQHDTAQNGGTGGEGDADQEMIEAEGSEENSNTDMEMDGQNC